MGGLDTEIGPATSDVLIEAARFDPLNVRRTSRALGLHSDSSYRFERPIDPEVTEWASRRCTELILETAGGTLHPGHDRRGCVSGRAADRHAPARPDRAGPGDRDRPGRGRRGSCWRLGLNSEGGPPEAPRFRPPSWRSDLEREIDLIEEVARDPRLRAHSRRSRGPARRGARGPSRAGRGRHPVAPGRPGVRRGDHPQLRPRRAGRIAWSPTRPGRRSGSSTRSASEPTRSGRAWSRACWPSAAQRGPRQPRRRPVRDRQRLPASARPAPTRRADPLDAPERSRLPRAEGDRRGGPRPVPCREGAGSPPEPVPLVHARPVGGVAPGRDLLGRIGEVDRAKLDALDLQASCSAAELTLGVLVEKADLVPRHHPLAAGPGRRARPLARRPPDSPLGRAGGRRRPSGRFEPGSDRLSRRLPGRQHPRGSPEPPFRPPVPPPRADPDRRRGRAIGPGDRRSLRLAIRGDTSILTASTGLVRSAP